VTRSSHRRPLIFKGLRQFHLIEGKLTSENRTKIAVKFLKKHPVERLWNAA
jgi:hypothetical protein